MPTKQSALDATDRRILSELSRNGRISLTELAPLVGLSQSPCWTRVKRLEESGIISGYAALIDHNAIGLGEVVFVEVTLDNHTDDRVAEFGEQIARVPEVLEAHLVAGAYDYLLKVVVGSTAEYERFLRDRLYKIKGIRQSRSTFALRTLKSSPSVDPLVTA
jgi:Lrp/AsnC family leucine-responsive transcriptional regulator